MLSPRCLSPYLIELKHLNTTAAGVARPGGSASAIRNYGEYARRKFWLQNVFCFSPPSNFGRFDLLCQTFQIVDWTTGETVVKTLVEADYAIPKSLGDVPRSGTRVNCIADELNRELRQVWNKTRGGAAVAVSVADMGALETTASLSFFKSESAHDWMERVLRARRLLNELENDGCDVRPDISALIQRALNADNIA